jgi:hypothetical protein
MSEEPADPELDALLASALAPPDAPADRDFVARVDRVLTEAELYRRWQASMMHDLIADTGTFAALAGSLLFLLQAPYLREALADAPALAWPMALCLFVAWIVSRRSRADLLI